MHLQVLSSGSKGNATLVRAGETSLLVDAGLTLRELERRFEAARFSARGLDHIALSHGHLDHARSSGALSRRTGATLHLCERLMKNRSVARAARMATLRIDSATALAPKGTPAPARVGLGPDGSDAGPVAGLAGADGPGDALELYATKIPHDADPTVAFRLDHGGRRAVILTDMGEPRAVLGSRLGGAHVLVLEFNHDEAMLRGGPYPINLKRRVAGPGGHLSNAQAAEVLGHLAGPELHTLVLAHLSETNNHPDLALAAAHAKLDELGLASVRVLVAAQDEVTEPLEV